MKQLGMILACSLFLSACQGRMDVKPVLEHADVWQSVAAQAWVAVDEYALKKWWMQFHDEQVNHLVELALKDSPQRLMAEARVREARGISLSTGSALWPQLNAQAQAGREHTPAVHTDNYHQAGFDASFEIDVFGKNTHKLNAAQAQVQALQAQYQDTSLTLIAEIVRAYIDDRAFQKQMRIAEKNLATQEATLVRIRQQKEFGEATELDIQRTESLVNATKSDVARFMRLSTAAQFQLTILTGHSIEELKPFLLENGSVLHIDLSPVALTPAQILALRPDVRAAEAYYRAQTAQRISVQRDILPTLSLGAFFGLAETAVFDSGKVWSLTANGVMNILDFGRIRGLTNAAKAREDQAFQQLRLSVLHAVSEVETALSDCVHLSQEHESLAKALANAQKSLDLSQMMHKEGEISYLDVLDAQRTVYQADSALVNVEAQQAQAMVRLFKALGVY